MSSFDNGIKGMNAQTAAIQVASNNIANANTVGYKARQSLFVDEYFKAAPTGEDAGTRRDAAQGAMKGTSSALDLAVQGNGMFCLTSQVSGDTASSTYYSRNGSFAVNKDGYIVNANGLFLNGYQPNATRTGATNTVGALMMPPAMIEPKASSTGTLAANLDGRQAKPTVMVGGVAVSKPFLASDPSTYNASTSVKVFDANGVTHQVSLYFKKIDDTVVDVPNGDTNTRQATASQFEVYMEGDGVALSRDPAGNAGSATLGAAADTAATQAKAVYDTYVTALGNANAASNNYQSAVAATQAAKAAQEAALVKLAAVTPTEALESASPEAFELVSAAKALIAANSNAEVDGEAQVAAQDAFNDALDSYSGAAELTDSADILVAQQAVAAISVYSSATERVGRATTKETDSLKASSDASEAAIKAAEENAAAVETTRIGTLQFVEGQLLGSQTEPTLFNAQLSDDKGIGLFNVSLDLSKMTGFGSAFAVTKNSSDGNSLGALSGFSVDETGTMRGTYTNGGTLVAGQLALASFQAPDELSAAAGTVFNATSASGDPVLGTATSGSFGAVRSSSLEQSTVDMAAELVNLMILQRNYQASSQSLQAANTLLTTAINMGR